MLESKIIHKNGAMDYRREIDGLRALAVIPVILFHAGFSTFSGGFVGVDVFFVISGYLITSIVMADIEAGKFSIVNFYERRARRILPALFLVMLACLPFAWMWLLPKDMKGFSESLAAVSTFSSNILFWRTSGYFENDAELKPLLHTWSLAVEEQYYLFFPPVLALGWRLGRRWLIALLVVAFALSLARAQWASAALPAAAFYLLPARGWELLIGAFAAFYLEKDTRQPPGRMLCESGAAAGAALIAYAILAFDSRTPFPSLYTLVPTVGAVLIILCARSNTCVGKVLGSRIFVGIGLISYSIYLWHQPMLAFARHYSLLEPSKLLTGCLLALSVVFAYFSWRYIEAPFRNKKLFSRKSIFALGAAASVVFVVIGVVGRKTGGLLIPALRSKNFVALAGYDGYLNGKSEEEYWRHGCFNLTEGPEFFVRNHCEQVASQGQPEVFLVGDSHSAYLSQYFRFYLQARHYAFTQFSMAYCTPLTLLDRRERCREINRFILERIAAARPDYVVICAHYLKWETDTDNAETVPYDAVVKRAARQFREMGVKEVIVVGQIPTWEVTLPDVLFKSFVRRGAPILARTYEGVAPLSLDWDTRLASIQYGDGVKYVSLRNLLCNAAGCLTVVGPHLRSDLVVFDYGHLTAAGSKYVTDNAVAHLLP